MSHKTDKKSRREIVSLKAREAAKRTWADIGADWLAAKFGTVTFFTINAIWFLVWIAWNSGVMPGLQPFDPFPFGFLTMVVSLEAIFLSIIVLISQNRAAKVEELRQEIELEINTISEQEITKIMEMLLKLMKHHKLDISQDAELKEMLRPTNIEKIEKELGAQL